MPFEKYIDLRKLLSHPYAYSLFIALCPLPLICFIFYFMLSMHNLESLEEQIAWIGKKSAHFQESLLKESSFLASIKNPDHYYIDKHLETLTFLEPEVKKIEALLLENDQEDALKKRIQFLKGDSNRLLFSEEKIRQYQQFQEVEEKQQHLVEMNEEDLKKTLSLIEGITIWPYGPKENRPQLIITDLQLTKKELPSQESVFVVSLSLLKRESALNAGD